MRICQRPNNVTFMAATGATDVAFQNHSGGCG